ncbi:MAG: hypothetical protein ACFFDM_07045 [Candidatus Thorarchaeota archaeon]
MKNYIYTIFTMELIREYLFDIDTWEKMTVIHWDKDTYRLIRPEE